ncbi:MAG: phage tail tape measure protein, partial [Methanobacterium paludis]|nr:phage tail tape measure protein [Methanobacterium paludis]
MADKTLGIQVQMSIDDVLSGLSDLINKFTEIPDSITTDIQLGEDPTANVDNLKDELDDLSNTTTTTDIEVAGDTSGATDVKDALDELDGDTVSANVDVDNSDAVTGIDEVESGLDEIDGTTVSADVETTGTDEVTSSASDATTAITALASAVAVADAEATRMGSERSLQKALSYEGVSVTAANVSELRSELSKVQGAIPTDQASEGLYILAKGLKNASMVSAELPPAFKLIKTTGTDTSEAMYDLSSIITAYGLSTSEATSTTTYLTNAINDMSSNAGDPSTILSTVTALIPALKSVGYTANDIVDYIGAFGDSGISATVAASALTTGAKTLSKQLTEAKYSGSDAEGVLKTMGISAKDASGNFRSVSDIMSDVLDKSSSMSESQFEAQYGMTKLAAMQLLFGSRAAQTMSQLNESADTYGAKVTATGDKTTASMTKINTNTMTLQTQFQKLWNTITNAPALPTWLFEGAAITVGFVVLVKGLQLVGSALKTTYEFLGKVKSTTENLGTKAKDIWHAVFGSDEMSAELQTVETETGKYEVVESRIANTIRKFKTDAASLKDTRLFGDLFGEEGKLNTGALDSSYTKFSEFVTQTKTKAGELKESNVWKMLFGDEKGNLNFNIIDKAESKIISFVNTVKPKIEELNGI